MRAWNLGRAHSPPQRGRRVGTSDVDSKMYDGFSRDDRAVEGGRSVASQDFWG